MHSHPEQERKVLIAKIEFSVQTSMIFYDFLTDAKSYSYKHMAAKFAKMFDAEFERVAKDFKMDMTGLYVKFDDSLNHHHDDLIWDEHDHVFQVKKIIFAKFCGHYFRRSGLDIAKIALFQIFKYLMTSRDLT